MEKIDNTNFRDDMEQSERWYIASENIKWYSYLEDSLIVY